MTTGRSGSVARTITIFDMLIRGSKLRRRLAVDLQAEDVLPDRQRYLAAKIHSILHVAGLADDVVDIGFFALLRGVTLRQEHDRLRRGRHPKARARRDRDHILRR